MLLDFYPLILASLDDFCLQQLPLLVTPGDFLIQSFLLHELKFYCNEELPPVCSFISLCQYGLMDSYFILWVAIII